METVSRWVASTAHDDLPAEVRAKAAQGVLDGLGVALAGSRHPASRPVTTLVTDLGGRPEASVLGSGLRTSSVDAALANAYYAHVLDFDDTHVDAIVHVNAPVLAAALATAEATGASGAALLAAQAIGMEVTSRMAVAMEEHHDHGWHLTGVAGAFGAAAAAASVLRLDPERSAHALGAVSTMASGLRIHRGTGTKSLNPANAAANGVLAALAARAGMTSNPAVLDDARRGVLASHGVSTDPATLATGLGETYRMLGVEPKPYPCGVVVHAPVDAALDLLAEHRDRLTADPVESVALTVHPLVLELTGNPRPRTALETKFSVQHAVAVALLEGRLLPEHFGEDWAVRSDVVRLRDLVTATVDPGSSRHEATIRVRTRSGVELVRTSAARGTPARPMTTEDVEAKFRHLAAPVLGDGRAGEVVDHIRTLADTGKVSDLTALLGP